MVFATCVFVGIEKVLGRHLSKKDVQSFKGQVRIYGDDIIVPVVYVRSVIESLETLGFVVNSNKSFWTGKFRESCGKEYYDGHDVSVVKCRRVLPNSRKDASELVSMVSMRNLLFEKGFSSTVDWLDRRIEKLIPFPVVHPNSSILGRWSHFDPKVEMSHPYLQIPLVRGAVVQAKIPRDILEGSGALMKWLLKKERDSRHQDGLPYRGFLHDDGLAFEDKNHLSRSGRPLSVDIKIARRSPF
jgi:hypothetical protein